MDDHAAAAGSAADAAALTRLGAEQFVLLTTFRRSGEPVRTPVWVAPDGARLLVITSATTGKAKRLRHTSTVELAPCDRRGRVSAGATTHRATGTLRTDPETVQLARRLVTRKYGMLARVAGVVQTVLLRRRYAPAAVEISPAA